MGGVEVIGGWDIGFLILEFPGVAVAVTDVEADSEAASGVDERVEFRGAG